MVQFLSPEVHVDEFDISNYIAPVSVSVGAYVGDFMWGPVLEPRLQTKRSIFTRLFEKPTISNFVDYFAVSNFLAYSTAIRVVRVVNTTANNATASGTGILIKNRDDYRENYSNGEASVGNWAAKYPGSLGNTLRVSRCSPGPAFNSVMTGTATSNASSVSACTTPWVISFSANVKSDSTRPLQVGDFIRYSNTSSGLSTGWMDVIAINSTGTTVNVNTSNAVVNAVGASVVAKWRYADYFESAPNTGDGWVTTRGGANDEVHIVVVDRFGKFVNRPNTVLEKFAYVSVASDAKGAGGSSLYYRDVIDVRSQYIWWLDHDTAGTNWGNACQGTSFTIVNKPEYADLSGGSDASPTDGQKIAGYDLFADKEQSDVSLIMTGDHSQTVKLYVLQNVAEARKDAVAFISTSRASVVDNNGLEVDDITSYRSFFPSSSYGFFTDNWKYQYDPIRDVYVWLPTDSDVAGLAAKTDNDLDAWYSFAGYNRGKLLNTIKLAWNSTKLERDELYKVGINSIINVPNEGSILFGDKTMLLKPSAFDRINVRRLFIVLEKSIANAAKYLMFELNDAFTRAMFVNMTEPFLRDVQGRRGIYDYLVVCDETNNTPEVIDRNQFVGDIYIKPAKSINYIDLNFVAVRTGVEFSEIVGKFGG